MVNIDDYILLDVKVRENTDKKMSRLLVYVRNDVKYKGKNDLESKIVEFFWFDIMMEGRKKMNLWVYLQGHQTLRTVR